MKKQIFGNLSGHSVGIIFKELIRRAILEIRRRRFGFEVYSKILTSGKADIYTDADLGAEKIIVRSLAECFPDFDIISEEDKERKYLKSGNSKYITVDPLCGTKNFSQRASGGIATTIAMVIDGKIVSAFVGDVMTQEIFGYRPDSKKVHRISEFDTYEEIVPQCRPTDEGLKLLIRGMIHNFSPSIRAELESMNDLYTSYTIDSGSVSLSAAKLWKGEVDGLLLKPRTETPWDLMPVLGICNKLDFVFLKVSDCLMSFEIYNPLITKEIFTREDPVLIVKNMEGLFFST